MKNTINLILTACLTALLCACGGKTEKTPSGETMLPPDIVNNPATANGETPEVKAPAFSFPENNYDFGSIKTGDQVSHTFEFTNTGNADLIITQVKASCGCTTPSYSKDPVKPGDKGKIEVTFNSTGMAGQIVKDITILANTTPTTKVLTISGEVIRK